MAEIRDVVGSLDETVNRDVVTYSQKIGDVGTLLDAEAPSSGDNLDVLTGADKPLVVRVYGQDLDVLRREANDVRDIVGGVDGVLDPRSSACPRSRSSRSRRTSQSGTLGIKPGDVRRSAAMLLQGIRSATSSASKRCSRSS